ncbi:hypothetical protein PSPO01_09307 [Paraphaeosphaeria sporulosa]
MSLGSLALFCTLEAASLATKTSLLTSSQIVSSIIKPASTITRATRTARTPIFNAPSSAQSSLPSAIPTHEPGTPPTPKIANLTAADDGWKHGNVLIYNWCTYDVYFVSVGAHYLGGYRNGSTTGWGTPEDAIYHTIPSGTQYTEPFRASAGCPYTGAPPYCPLEDKLAGQAVSIKIARSNDPADQNITQLEYALYRNPNTHDTFKRLYYDVSLLDCGAPDIAVTDFNATEVMLARKVERCPGYAGGVAVTFSADEGGKVCPPVYCDGISRCFMVYTFDRTRRQESSFTCEKEYRGDLRLDLCVKKADEGVQGMVENFSIWAQTATHEVVMLQMNKTTPPLVRSTPLSALQTVASVVLQMVTLGTRTSTVVLAARPANVRMVASSSTAA